jgi:outer membrane protein TolC
MSRAHRCRCRALAVLAALGLALAARAQDAPAPMPAQLPPTAVVPPATLPAAAPCDRPLPINLPTALQLADSRPIDIAVAAQRIQQAAAQLERANVLWLPTVFVGTDYFRHDGQIQDVQGNVFGTSKSQFMLGVAPYMVFALSDAIFSPLAARQVVRAREAGLQAARNDSFLAVAEAYFNVQQARGELAGAEDAERRAAEVARRAEALSQSLAPPLEAARARAELARRRQAVHLARERWRTAGAELTRLLRLDPAAAVEPLEPPHLPVTLLSLDCPVDDLIAVGLTNRPELAAQQALVQATLQQLRQEKVRPLVPSVLLRGSSTPVTGTLAAGVFGGGLNGSMNNFSMRSDFDLQVLWELQNFGLGNRARVHERKAENQVALLELFRTQDRVAAEVVQAYHQAKEAAARRAEAEAGLKDALELANRSVEAMSQTRQAGNVILLVVRPQEVVAAVQALAQAYADFYGAIADYNRAQFRLYRALGHPAQAVAPDAPPSPGGAAVNSQGCNPWTTEREREVVAPEGRQ